MSGWQVKVHKTYNINNPNYTEQFELENVEHLKNIAVNVNGGVKPNTAEDYSKFLKSHNLTVWFDSERKCNEFTKLMKQAGYEADISYFSPRFFGRI